jgi:hypothetical protein
MEGNGVFYFIPLSQANFLQDDKTVLIFTSEWVQTIRFCFVFTAVPCILILIKDITYVFVLQYYRTNKRIFPVDYFIQIFCKLPNTYTFLNYEREINFPSLSSGDANYLRARYVFPPLKCAEWGWVNWWMQLSRGNQQLMELLSSHRSVARSPGAPPVIMKVLDLYTV